MAGIVGNFGSATCDMRHMFTTKSSPPPVSPSHPVGQLSVDCHGVPLKLTAWAHHIDEQVVQAGRKRWLLVGLVLLMLIVFWVSVMVFFCPNPKKRINCYPVQHHSRSCFQWSKRVQQNASIWTLQVERHKSCKNKSRSADWLADWNGRFNEETPWGMRCMSRSWSTMPPVKNTEIPISTFLHVGTFWIFLGYRIRMDEEWNQFPWSFCAFEGLPWVHGFFFVTKATFDRVDLFLHCLPGCNLSTPLPWLARTIWLLQEPLARDSFFDLWLKWIIWIIVPKASTSVRPILSFTPGPWTNMHERCKFLVGVLCVLSGSLSVFLSFYRRFPSGRRKWKSSTEQKGGEMATGWAAVCWYHSGMWLVTDIPYYRCRVDSVSTPAGALKQTRPRKMATIEYPSRRWTRSGWEVRWEIFTASHLVMHFEVFLGKIQSCVFNQLLTVTLNFKLSWLRPLLKGVQVLFEGLVVFSIDSIASSLE